MKIYVVGGHVRDVLLGRKPKDTDFVVVGATEKELQDFGSQHSFDFKKVGADFPVYLDKHGNEWALARKERKIGKGYKGFQCDFDNTVTLEDDLFRRDLRINAMAMEVLDVSSQGIVVNNKVIDPYGGQNDLNNGILRHVSEHFAEDPVRVLRVARFAARYGFDVASETIDLIQKLCDSGEMDHLVPERVWAETEKALHEKYPYEFFRTLAHDNTAGDILFPKVYENMTMGTKLALSSATDTKEKLAVLFSFMPENDVKHIINKDIFPKKVGNFALNYNRLLSIIDRHGFTSRMVYHVFTKFDVYRNKSFLKDSLCTSANFASETLIDEIGKLCNLFDKTRGIGYNNLPESKKQTLSGRNIKNAIWEMRKEVIDSST